MAGPLDYYIPWRTGRVVSRNDFGAVRTAESNVFNFRSSIAVNTIGIGHDKLTEMTPQVVLLKIRDIVLGSVITVIRILDRDHPFIAVVWCKQCRAAVVIQ